VEKTVRRQQKAITGDTVDLNDIQRMTVMNENQSHRADRCRMLTAVLHAGD
jgi:hypothetical protein